MKIVHEVHNTKICLTLQEAVFRFLKKAAVRHLGFLKVGKDILDLTSGLVRRPNMCHYTKFHAHCSYCCGDMAIFNFYCATLCERDIYCRRVSITSRHCTKTAKHSFLMPKI